MVPILEGIEPATSWSSVGCTPNVATETGRKARRKGNLTYDMHPEMTHNSLHVHKSVFSWCFVASKDYKASMSVARLIVVLFVVFLCSDFRLPLNPLLSYTAVVWLYVFPYGASQIEGWAQDYCNSNIFLKPLFRGNLDPFVNNANLGAIAHTSNGT